MNNQNSGCATLAAQKETKHSKVYYATKGVSGAVDFLERLVGEVSGDAACPTTAIKESVADSVGCLSYVLDKTPQDLYTIEDRIRSLTQKLRELIL